MTLALRLLQILTQIHKAKIVHKDIKPDNILVDPKNLTITLFDFSLAQKASLKTQPHEGEFEGSFLPHGP
ncbi:MULTISPECIES: protein kinase domain-containing protein [Bacteria]|uniref:protein kinase domain-containing protein n=1 Tax=Bacteria TaxID=2 RepID=UPI0009B7098D